jgi:hypothetical protein
MADSAIKEVGSGEQIALQEGNDEVGEQGKMDSKKEGNQPEFHLPGLVTEDPHSDKRPEGSEECQH